MLNALVVVTGGAGFIGSNLVEELGRRGQLAVVIDGFGDPLKWANLRHPSIHDLVCWTKAFEWLDANADAVAKVFHLGAVSATTVNDIDVLLEKNIHFTNRMWDWCAGRGKPLVYASSAATYGDGVFGFSDRLTLAELEKLRPLNPYAWSKHLVDLRILRTVEAGMPQPPAWFGVKFFNVYGPREHHKGGMRSVALKLFETVQAGGDIELFRSHRADYRDGMQLRDFVYVSDCVDVLLWLLDRRPPNGIYNIGTGRAEPFLEIAETVIVEAQVKAGIRFIDMPDAIRDRYQYFTEADMGKLREAGYNGPFRTVRDGVRDYVRALSAAER